MKSIVIIGKRWFQKTYGNTYYSSVAIIDGEEKARIDFAYGYGNQYEWDMVAKLRACGALVGIADREPLWQYCERNGITLQSIVSDVRRKKDL